jgi:hypothetical protein
VKVSENCLTSIRDNWKQCETGLNTILVKKKEEKKHEYTFAKYTGNI